MTVHSIDPMDRIPVQVYRHPVGACEAVARQIEWAVPLSPSELDRKRSATFKHESQKDRALFPGHNKREFWQRAEQRNCETAQLYDRLGLAEYAAMEGFVRWDRSQHDAT